MLARRRLVFGLQALQRRRDHCRRPGRIEAAFGLAVRRGHRLGGRAIARQFQRDVLVAAPALEGLAAREVVAQEVV